MESYRTLSPAAVKDMQARADSLNLHEDAALLAYRLLGTAGSRILITLDPPQAESAKAVTVTVIRDGFLDDSVRGDWHRFFLHRDGGAWEITDIQQAFRCRRGASTNSFNQGLCP